MWLVEGGLYGDERQLRDCGATKSSCEKSPSAADLIKERYAARSTTEGKRRGRPIRALAAAAPCRVWCLVYMPFSGAPFWFFNKLQTQKSCIFSSVQQALAAARAAYLQGTGHYNRTLTKE